MYAVGDHDPVASGGARWLAGQGVDVVTAEDAGVHADLVGGAARLTAAWASAVRRHRPWVVGKTAMTLDGRVAAADGTSRWITGTAARAHAHTVRADVDAVLVGTGTVLSDDPALTARRPDGSLEAHQPLRVVLGRRAVPPGAAVRQAPGDWLHLPTRDLRAALDRLWDMGLRRVLVEGGPTLLSRALREDLVDELHAYLAPVLLGAGRPAVDDLGVTTLADAPRWRPVTTRTLGEDLLVVAHRPEGDL